MSEEVSQQLKLDAPLNAEAANRSRLYALIAEAFTYPESDSALRLLNGDWWGEVLDILEQTTHADSQSFANHANDAFQTVGDLQAAYSALLDVTSGAPKLSLLERRYGNTPEQKLWERLLGFYSHFGLDFSNGYAQEQTDHLLTELSFMHYLCFLEAGTSTGVEDLRRGQRDFLAVHLQPFVNAIAVAFRELEGFGFFRSIVELMANVVANDLAALEQSEGVGGPVTAQP